jgi:hypothetical protein
VTLKVAAATGVGFIIVNPEGGNGIILGIPRCAAKKTE